jgi:hypothetical protein
MILTMPYSLRAHVIVVNCGHLITTNYSNLIAANRALEVEGGSREDLRDEYA